MRVFRIIILCILICTLSQTVNAAETKNNSYWGDNSSVFQNGFESQEPVTDSKFKKTIEQLRERSLSNKQKKIQKEVQPLSPSSDFEHLKEFANSQSPDDELSQTHTVMIPTNAYNIDGQKINPGFYKLSCRKIAKDEYVLDLSQGTKTILTVKAQQTSQDLEQDTISFCNAEIISDNRIRLMYGSIDLNLAAYLYYED